MNDKGKIIAMNAVRFTRTPPAHAALVWKFLTRTENLPAWFGEGRIEPRIGGVVHLMGGHIRGTVTQWHPPHHLAYTWNVFEPQDAADARSAHPESYLQLDLTAQGDATLLTLTHFPVPEEFHKQTCMGWHTYLDLTEAATKGNTSLTRADLMQKNAAIYCVDLNNLAR